MKKTLLLAACTLALLACNTSSDAPHGRGGDAGASGGGGSGGSGGSGPAPSCDAPAALEVEIDDAKQEVESATASGEWTALGGREVFRIRLETNHNPRPEGADDEFTVVTVLDVVPSQLLRLQGDPLHIDETLGTESAAAGRSFVDDARLERSFAANHATEVYRVLLEQPAFGVGLMPTTIHVVGELAVQLTDDHHVRGTLELDVDGRVPLAFTGMHTRIAGCFDFVVTPPAACQPGTECGNDCLDPSEWPCGACGTLYQTHDCQCRPDNAPLEACTSSSEPAPLGALCGEEWWCNRPCADGLVCTRDPSYGQQPDDDADAGADSGPACDYYSTCQRP